VILSDKAQNIYLQITKEGTKLGDLRKIAKEVKKNQQLAEETLGNRKILSKVISYPYHGCKATGF
jgi:hypothetical protein